MLRKMLIVILITFVGLITALYVISKTIILDSFTSLETQYAQQNVERARNAINGELDMLEATNGDWANWDDTYNFVQGLDDTYIQLNFEGPTLSTLQINAMLFYNTAGELVYGRTADLEAEQEMPPTPELEAAFAGIGSNLQLQAGDEALRGVIVTPNGPMLVVVLPILPTSGEGAAVGHLLCGLYLNPAEVLHLAESLHLQLSAYRFDDPGLPDDFDAARRQLMDGKPEFVTPLDEQVIAGYTALPDLFGNPALILGVHASRDVYARGQATLSYLALAIVIVGVAFGVIAMILLFRLERIGEIVTGSQNRLQTVVHSAPVTLWTVNRSGIFTLQEGRDADILGLTQGQIVGRNINDIRRRVPELADAIHTALGGNEVSVNVRVGGFTYDVRCVPLRSMHGQITGAMGVATDISARTTAEASLQRVSGNLEKRDRQLQRLRMFFQLTLEQLSQTLMRTGSKSEIQSCLEQSKTNFDRLNEQFLLEEATMPASTVGELNR